MRARSRIILSLVLGAFTTLGVAWACALCTPNSAAWYTTLNINQNGAEPARSLNIQQEARGGRELIQLRIQYAVGPAYVDWRMTPGAQSEIEEAMASFPGARGESPEAIRTLEESAGSVGPYGWPRWPWWMPDIPEVPTGLATYSARASGWPLRAMRSVGRSTDPDLPAHWQGSWRVLTADHYQQPADPQMGAIPLEPIALGFAGDTLSLGLAWWLILMGPGDIRRWNRRRQNRCERCAYSLEGLPSGSPCPECGEVSQIRRLPISATTTSTISSRPSPPLG